VLAGIVGALAASGVDVLTAGSAGAWLHASAASFGPSRGFVASDLLEHLPDALAALG
jgi:NAD(P)H-hydrate repair Nnr-like enzyme with NAD(P)H-hydrate dehydratase domain